MKNNQVIFWEETYINIDDEIATMTCYDENETDIVVTINYCDEEPIIKHFDNADKADRYLRKKGFIQ